MNESQLIRNSPNEIAINQILTNEALYFWRFYTNVPIYFNFCRFFAEITAKYWNRF